MSDALDRIKELAAKGFIRYTFHARQRMDERDATEEDVRQALRTATDATHQADRDNYRVSGGADLDGDSMSVVVVIEADVVVVTLF